MSLSKQQIADVATIKRLLKKNKSVGLDADDKMIIRILTKRAPLAVRAEAITVYNTLARAEGLELID